MTCFRRFYARYSVKDGRLLYGSRASEAVVIQKKQSGRAGPDKENSQLGNAA